MLLRDYFNSYNFDKNGELPRNQIGRSGAQVKKENETFTVVGSRSPQNLEFGHFRLLFCRERQRHVSKFKPHGQSDCCLLIKPNCSLTLSNDDGDAALEHDVQVLIMLWTTKMQNELKICDEALFSDKFVLLTKSSCNMFF